MDKIKRFQKAITDYLSEYAKTYNQDDADPIRTQLVFDKENHHYQLVRVGWKKQKFYHYCIFHFDIINDKIWIQANNTEEMVGDELVERGVLKKEIVLGFQPDYKREFTGFAVA